VFVLRHIHTYIHEYVVYLPIQVVRYKSMNHLSFVTRFQLIRNGTSLEVTGSKSHMDTQLEDMPFVYDKSRYLCNLINVTQDDVGIYRYKKPSKMVKDVATHNTYFHILITTDSFCLPNL
jgi:hypothetical protein